MNKWFLYIALLFCGFSVYAQEDLKENSFDREKWNNIRKSIKYKGRRASEGDPIDGELGNGTLGEGGDSDGYNGSGGDGFGDGGGSSSGSGSGDHKNYSRDKNNRDLERPPKQIERPRPRNVNFNPPQINPNVFWVIIIIIGILLIALIVFLIIKNSGNNKGVKSGISDIEIHDVNPLEIPKTELELRLEKAMAEGDYRECVRIYFIFSMKELVEKGHIRWEKEKTNMVYLQEIFGKSFYGSFFNVVNLFEIVWYGERKISKEQFQKVEPELKKCIKSIE